jgi:hypothetical protein
MHAPLMHIPAGTPYTFWVLLGATGYDDRAQLIQRYCKVGSPVQLRREQDDPSNANALAAWLLCSSFLGLLRRWRKIGYVKTSHADRWAAGLDHGFLHVESAVVCSCYTPAGEEVPRISLQIEFRSL